MSNEREKLVLPFLYGAPPHTLRRTAVAEPERPLGPDDLPIENYRSPEDQALASQLFPHAYTGRQLAQPSSVAPASDGDQSGGLRGTRLLLHSIAGRLLGPRGD